MGSDILLVSEIFAHFRYWQKPGISTLSPDAQALEFKRK
jgi:hypothetical protein